MTREEAIAEVFGITVEELEEALQSDIEAFESPYERLLEAAVDSNPVAVQREFADIMLDKIRAAVEDRKAVVAAQLFGYEPPKPDEAEVEVPEEIEDEFDFDDEFAELFGDDADDDEEAVLDDIASKE